MKTMPYIFLVSALALSVGVGAVHSACSPAAQQKIVQVAPKLVNVAGAVCDVIVEFEDSDAMRSACLTVESIKEYLARPKPASAVVRPCLTELVLVEGSTETPVCLSLDDLRALANEQAADGGN